jgi:acetyltransferase-like isoleucine patch superfamily enzyme
MNNIARQFRYDLPLFFILKLTNWLPDNLACLRMRGKLASPFLGSCGKNLTLGRNISFYNPANIHIGRDVYIAYGCWFLGVGKLQIGNEVLFGPYVVISPGNHTKVNGSFRFGEPVFKNIKIGNGSWIGAHVSILLGAEVGEGSVIAANSVLNMITECHSLYAGLPAKFIKKV